MHKRKKIVVFSGAGMSAESGLKTFRDSDGLWEGYHVEDVATPDAWYRNPKLVMDFYNERRRGVLAAKPNAGHLALVELEKTFEVEIITQNVDDLHERAGSSSVLHLHGEIRKSQSTGRMERVYLIEGDTLELGQVCEDGYQLRPFIVWFGEAVPMMDRAIEITRRADIFLVIGTSLAVYPAASLLQYVNAKAERILIDPKASTMNLASNIRLIAAPASSGVAEITAELMRSAC